MVLLHQLEKPVLFNAATDVVALAMQQLLAFEALLVFPFLSYTTDILLLVLPFILVFRSNIRWLAIVNLIIWGIYILLYNTYGTHHTHSMLGIMIVGTGIIFTGKPSFNRIWAAVRYYVLWIMAAAGLWKLFRGAIFQQGQGTTIFADNLSGFIYEQPDHFLTGIYTFLLRYPVILNTAYIIAVLMELLFITGFFTRKYDQWLMVMLSVLISGFWFIADATFFELLICLLPLIRAGGNQQPDVRNGN